MEGKNEGDDLAREKRKESRAAVLRRHKAEKKAMKQETDRLRSSVAKQEASKAGVNQEVAKMYSSMERRHAEELKQLEGEDRAEPKDLTEGVRNLEIKETVIPPFYSANRLKRDSKAARRRRRKAEREAESQKQIEAEKKNMGPSQKALEMDKILRQLRPLSLTIHEIKPDGHCMYRAVSHQITCKGLNVNVDKTVEGLRDAVATHMLKRKHDFMPFIDTVNGDEKAFKEYCKNVRLTASWGGQVELRALNEILGLNIQVFSADMPVVTMGKDTGKDSALSLSYHRHYYELGEHYNSVVAIADNSTGEQKR